MDDDNFDTFDEVLNVDDTKNNDSVCNQVIYGGPVKPNTSGMMESMAAVVICEYCIKRKNIYR